MRQVLNLNFALQISSYLFIFATYQVENSTQTRHYIGCVLENFREKFWSGLDALDLLRQAQQRSHRAQQRVQKH